MTALAAGRGRATGGFTLIEVLIALCVASIAMIVLSQGVSSSLAVLREASRVDQAASRARSRLAAAERGHLAAGVQSGDDGGGYRWRVTTKLVASTASRLMAVVNNAPGSRPTTSLYAVSVTETWTEADHDKQITLASQAVGSASAAPQ